MNARETKFLKQEIEKYLHFYSDALLDSASVCAFINKGTDASKQYLKVSISSLYLITVDVEFNRGDFKNTLFSDASKVIENKIIRALDTLTRSNTVREDALSNNTKWSEREARIRIKRDIAYLREIKYNLEESYT